MDCAGRRAGAEQPGADLHQAAGVARRNELGRARGDERQLSVQDHVRHLGLDQVVDARAAAAHLAFGQRYELELRNGTQHVERRVGDALRVRLWKGELDCLVKETKNE